MRIVSKQLNLHPFPDQNPLNSIFFFQISKTVKICASLLQLDYTIAEIPNYNGDLSTNYPSHILVPESEKPRSGSSPAVIYEQQTFDATKFRDLIKSARLARCRARFPIPVIFYRGKYVCRSATLSGGAEIYTRSGFDYFYGSSNGGKASDEIGESTDHCFVRFTSPSFILFDLQTKMKRLRWWKALGPTVFPEKTKVN